MKKKKKKNDKWNIILHPKWPINLAGVFVLTRIRSRVNPFIEENSSAIDPREREREREYDRVNFDRPLRSLHDVQSPFNERSNSRSRGKRRSTRATLDSCVHRLYTRVYVCVCVSCTRIGSFTNAELLKASALLSPGRHDNEYFHS